MPNSTTPEINLIEEDELVVRPGGKAIRWALSYGKGVLVLTELLVVIALILRFYFYSSIADLNEEIDRKLLDVKSKNSVDFETKFRSLVLRIDRANGILNGVEPNEVLETAKKEIPEGLTITNLTVTPEEIVITGKAQTEASLATLAVNFKKSPPFASSVSVDKFTKGEGNDDQISFILRAKYRKV